MLHSKAHEYNEMIEKYVELRERVNELIMSGKYDPSLLDEMEELKDRLDQFNAAFIFSPHYIVPDDEFTFH